VPYIVIIPAGADAFYKESSDFFDNRELARNCCHLCRGGSEAARSEKRDSKEKREKE
jgi:hypothetical protein